MRNSFFFFLLAVFTLLIIPAQAVASPIPTLNQTLWLRADDGVTKDGSNFVSSWGDQAPLNGTNDATQGTASSQPLWVDNQLNGHAVIRFDGTNDLLANTSYTHGTDSLSLFLVAKRNGVYGGAYHNIFIQNATPGSPATNFQQIYATDSNQLRNNYSAALDINTTTVLSDTDFMILNSNKDNAGGGNNSFYINAASGGTSTGNQALANNFFIGSWNGNDFNGDIAEVIMYNSPVSESDRQLIEGSLAWKYGLEASLPVSHPFANINPNLTAAPIPEPATLSLLGLGLLAIARRRRQSGR